MIRDAHGRKMSKSLGNVIDPLDVIDGISLENLHKKLEDGNLDPREVDKAMEGQKRDFPKGIPQCGSDALRFALLSYTSAGRDISIDILRVEGYRKFGNKLWNAIRLAQQKLGDDFEPAPYGTNVTGIESLSDLWILNKLNFAIRETNQNLEQRNFMQATGAVYNFWLYELCDVYLEICKPVIDGTDEVRKKAARETLYSCLENGLKLLHPFMPFLTEELWQRLPRRKGDPITETIMLTKFPVELSEWNQPQAEADFESVNKVVRASRSLLSDYNILKNGTLFVQTSNQSLFKILQSDAAIITSGLVKGASSLKVLNKDEEIPVGCAVYTLSEDSNVYLLVKGMVDFDAEVSKLETKKQKAEKELGDLKKKTEAPNYETKVKADVREATSAKVRL
jgi:valyl-tRNA synthetase